MKNLQLFKAIGLMSGTSMDGIDAAWIETDGLFHVRSLGNFSVSHDASFYQEMKTIEASIKEIIKSNALTSTSVQKYLEEITQKIDYLHVRAVGGLCKKYHLNLSTKNTEMSVDILGYHGQTIYHQPELRMSIQMGNPQRLSNDLRIPVMGNVRQRDIQLGGQGAPVAPIYHQALVMRDNLAPAAVINCGGISNITGIIGKEPEDLMGFDAGPGNGLLDRWVYQKTKGQESMDKDGKYALTGKIHSTVLKELYSASCLKDGSNFYEKLPPKSLDIRDFNWPSSLEKLSLEDGCATLAAFTAQCIVDALKFIPKLIKNIILVGGGWHHPLILQILKDLIEKQYKQPIQIVRGDEIGWHAQYLEAELMAFLAVRCLQNNPITFPMTTGVPYPVVGGDIFYPE